jgi:hypothetical protein
VLVAERSQGHGVLLERVKLRDGDLDVDHRLGREAAHRSRPVVLNSESEWPKGGGDAIAFGGKRLRPSIIIRNNLQSQHGPSISLDAAALGRTYLVTNIFASWNPGQGCRKPAVECRRIASCAAATRIRQA